MLPPHEEPPLGGDAARRLPEDLTPDALARLANTFEADLRHLVARLRATTGVGDAAERARAAHALAGAAANLGASRLEALARAAATVGASEGGGGGGGAPTPEALLAAGGTVVEALRRLATLRRRGTGDT